MRCQRVQSLYEDYSRGEVAPAMLASIDEHLAVCESCRQIFDENDRVADLVRSQHEVAHPGPGYFEDLGARVLAKLDQEDAATAPAEPLPALKLVRSRMPLWWTGAAAAAALLAIAILPEALSPTSPPGIASSPENKQTIVASSITPSSPGGSPHTTVGIDIQPLLDPALTGSQRPVGPLRSAATTLDKGIAGHDGREDYETVMAQTKPSGPATQPGRAPVEMQPVKLEVVKPKPTPRVERFDPSALLEQELAASVDGTMIEKLRGVERTMERRSPELDAQGQALAKQLRLYLTAGETLSGGDPMDAGRIYRRILMVDSDSALAQRSRMHIADLSYSQWGDFSSAQQYYQASLDGTGAALTGEEREHARRQLDHLERYSGDNWRMLGLVHSVRSEGWPQALAALRALSDDAKAAELMPEAARAVVERLKTDSDAPAETTMDVWRLLNDRTGREEAGEIRAWLELAIGDLAMSQFQDVNQALARYRKAAEMGEGSDAARLARLQIDSLVEQSLIEHLR